MQPCPILNKILTRIDLKMSIIKGSIHNSHVFSNVLKENRYVERTIIIVFRTFVLLESIIWKNICIYIDNHPFVKIYDLTEVLETCCIVEPLILMKYLIIFPIMKSIKNLLENLNILFIYNKH